MESFATGLKRINDSCKAAGVKFEFIREPYGFTVRFHRHCGEGWSRSDNAKDTVKDNDPHDVPHDVPHKETLEIMIEKMIRENPHITRTQIAEKVGMSVKTIARKLKTMDHIKYEGSGNNGYWVIIE